MATVRIAVFLATFHIALGILNPCEYDYLPYFRSRTFFIRILFIFYRAPPPQVYHLQMYFSNAYVMVFYNYPK